MCSPFLSTILTQPCIALGKSAEHKPVVGMAHSYKSSQPTEYKSCTSGSLTRDSSFANNAFLSCHTYLCKPCRGHGPLIQERRPTEYKPCTSKSHTRDNSFANNAFLSCHTYCANHVVSMAHSYKSAGLRSAHPVRVGRTEAQSQYYRLSARPHVHCDDCASLAHSWRDHRRWDQSLVHGRHCL